MGLWWFYGVFWRVHAPMDWSRFVVVPLNTCWSSFVLWVVLENAASASWNFFSYCIVYHKSLTPLWSSPCVAEPSCNLQNQSQCKYFGAEWLVLILLRCTVWSLGPRAHLGDLNRLAASRSWIPTFFCRQRLTTHSSKCQNSVRYLTTIDSSYKWQQHRQQPVGDRTT